MGVLYAIVGCGTGLHVSIAAANVEYKYFYIYSTLAAFLSAKFGWQILIEKKGREKLWHFICAAFVIGIISHVLCWSMFFTIDALFSPSTHQDTSFTAEGVVTSVLFPFALSFFSLYIYGWITLPAIIFIALGFWLVSVKKNPSPPGG